MLFDFDVLTCPRCGGRLRVIATVQDPLAVQAILAYLARSGDPAPPGSAPATLMSPAPHFRLDAAPDRPRRTPLPAP